MRTALWKGVKNLAKALGLVNRSCSPKISQSTALWLIRGNGVGAGATKNQRQEPNGQPH